MSDEARDLLRIVRLYERHDRETCRRLNAYLVGRWGLPITDTSLAHPPAGSGGDDRQWVRLRQIKLHKNAELRAQVNARDGGQCRYCGITVDWHDRRSPKGATYDHVDPDGESTLENIVTACRGCNSRKGYHFPEDVAMVLHDPPLLSTSELTTAVVGQRQNGSGNGHGSPPAPPVFAFAEKSLKYREEAIEVLNFLNLKADRTYRDVPENLKLIQARLRSGATVQDCKSVIARKVRAWISNPDQAIYLRPKTLFSATNFEQYLGEKEPS